MGWLLTTVTFPFTPHSQSVLSPGNMVGKWSCKPLSIALCPTAVFVCRVENGNELKGIGVRAAVWVGVYSVPLTRAGPGPCFVSFSVKWVSVDIAWSEPQGLSSHHIHSCWEGMVLMVKHMRPGEVGSLNVPHGQGKGTLAHPGETFLRDDGPQ